MTHLTLRDHSADFSPRVWKGELTTPQQGLPNYCLVKAPKQDEQSGLGMANTFKRVSFLPVTLFAIFIWSFATVLVAQGTAPSPDKEQILSYDSDITVNPNGTLLVRDTITVFATGAQIKHGIHRDFPTRYNDRFGNPYFIHFEAVSLDRDGEPEAFRLRRVSNGLRIYMGKSSELVPSGQHTYELIYTIDRELGFFPDYDELYWNVTGNAWIFPIQEASATVHLPKGIAQEAILLDAYTGREGSAATDYTASADGQSNATFRTTRTLGPYEGLTIVARWPKRFVRLPTDDDKHRYFLEDNQPSLIGLAGLIVVLIYYTSAWFLVGRNLPRGEIRPRSEPPRGFSPAALRYVWRMAFDHKTLVVDLVDLAVKKHLAILEDNSGDYILGRLKPSPPPTAARHASSEDLPPEITPDEKLVLGRLFAAGDTIRLGPSHYALVGGAVEALHHHLRSNLEKGYFVTSRRYLIPGLLISLAAIVYCGFSIQGAQKDLVLFLAVWLLPWSMGCLTLIVLAIAAWRNALSDPHHAPTARKRAILMSAICLALWIGEVAGLGAMAWAASSDVVILFIVLVAISYLFHNLIKAPTRLGRALLNHIEGFRIFLTTSEQDRRDASTPGKNSPEVFERYLPYAMALNAEKVWGDKFSAASAQAAQGGTMAYSPGWYSGAGWDPLTASTFATSLGNSFSSAISSSTTAPRSRSVSGASRSRRGGAG